MVLRLQDSSALSGGAASLFKSAADLTFDGARLKAQAMGGIGAGLEDAAKNYAAGKQRKFENARQTSNDAFARQVHEDSLALEQYHADIGAIALAQKNSSLADEKIAAASLLKDEAALKSAVAEKAQWDGVATVKSSSVLNFHVRQRATMDPNADHG